MALVAPPYWMQQILDGLAAMLCLDCSFAYVMTKWKENQMKCHKIRPLECHAEHQEGQ